jgi:hypothetical protein
MTTENIDTLFAELVAWHASFNEKKPDYHLYALIDGVLDSSLLGQAERSGAAWRSLYPETMLESRTPSMGPLLVALTPGNDGHDAFMRLLLARTQTQDLVIWVASRQPLAALAAHWQAYAEVILPDGRRALLRHYDPSILQIVVPMFDAKQRADFLAGAREYRYWRAGWRSVGGNDAAVLPEPPADYITLTPAQFQLLSNESYAETLYLSLKEELLPPASAMDCHDCVATIRALLARAVQTHGLKNQNDLAYFALMGLNVHPSFDTYEPVAKVLAEKSESSAPLATKLAGIDGSVWDALLSRREDAT